MKNKESRLFQELKGIRSQHKLLLTGTPLQNNITELFMLLHFLDHNKFDSVEDFEQQFSEIGQEEQVWKRKCGGTCVYRHLIVEGRLGL